MNQKKVKFFIAGTDTGVGKTCVSAALLHAAQIQGFKTLGLKPVAAGADLINGTYQNEDAAELMRYSSVTLPYEQVNPVCLNEPIAPHIAAQREGKSVSVSRLMGYCRGALMNSAELTIIEGAGGWRVPLNPRETMADLAKELNVPVILVVGMRLGCLNHTLLTVEAMVKDGVQIAGWISNQLSPDMDVYKDNITAIQDRLAYPLLAEIPFSKVVGAEQFIKHVDINKIMGLSQS